MFCRWQEVVNLLLTGSALSHVFNDTLERESATGEMVIERGVSERADVGLLSLEERFKKLQVGGCTVVCNLRANHITCSSCGHVILFALGWHILEGAAPADLGDAPARRSLLRAVRTQS